MIEQPLTVAWFSFFPVEWLPDLPAGLPPLSRHHAASWQRVLLGELEKVPNLKLHVIVLRKQFGRDFTFERNGVTFHLVKTRGGLRAPTFFWHDTLLIKKKIAAIKPDVVHAWGTEQGAALVANRLGLPRVVTIQGLMSWYEKLMPYWYVKLSAWLERRSLRRSPLVTTEARFSVQYVRHQFPGVRVEQIEHAPDWAFHRVVRRPQTKPVRFIFVGALDFRKGGDLMLQALDAVKEEIDFELVAIGKTYLETNVSPELKRRITFKEQLTHVQIADELSTATMMLCPSRADVSPNSVKEAVVAGVPVIGSAVGGIPDYVFPGRNGVLHSPDNLPELIEAIRAACRHPQFSKGEVDATTLAQTREYLSPKLMGEKFLAAYRLALGRGGAPVSDPA